MSKLAAVEKSVVMVSWYTNSWDREKGKVGLSQYLAEKFGFSDAPNPRIDLCSSNDSDYTVDANVVDMGEYDVGERAELYERVKNGDGIEDYELHILVTLAVEKGWLKPATYIIEVS